MITKRILPFLIAVSLGAVMAHGQQMKVTSAGNPANPNDYKFEITVLPWPFPPPPSPPVTPTLPPFYWVFTLYGNGEYSPILERTKVDPVTGLPKVKFCWENYDPLPPLTSPHGFRKADTMFYYAYPPVTSISSLNYTPVTYAIPRKGDPPTPPPAGYSGKLTSVTSITPNLIAMGSRAPTMPAGKSIYLAHSQGYLIDRLNGKKSVFVISYNPPECMNAGGAVHLFYGRKRTGSPSTSPLPSSYTRSNHLLNPAPINPVYFSALPSPTPTLGFATSTIIPAAQYQFEKHSTFNFNAPYVTAVKNAIGNNTMGMPAQHRFFQEIEFSNPPNTSPEYLNAADWSYALAVLTSNSPCPCPPESIKALVQGMGDEVNLANCTLNGQHIVDADTIYLKSGEPNDPNRLVIKKVCENGFVLLNLQFCNLSPLATSDALGARVKFSIIDLNNFEWCKIDGMQYPVGTKMNITSCQPLCFGTPQPNTAWYNCADHSIEINGPLVLGACTSVDVVLKLKSSVGLMKHLTQQHILEATVWLHPEDVPLTVTNETLDPTEGPSLPTYCPEQICQQPWFCFSIWYVLGIVALVVAGIWRVLRRKKDQTNT